MSDAITTGTQGTDAGEAVKAAIKTAGGQALAIINAAEGGWDKIIIKGANGKVDLDATRRALGLALRDHLKAVGALSRSAVQPRKVMDWDNLLKAAYAAFVKQAKDQGQGVYAAPLMEVVYAAMTSLSPSFADMDRVKKLVRAAMDLDASPFQIHSTGKNFEGARVTLKDPTKATLPVPFKSWAEMQTPAAPAAATPAAEAPAAQPEVAPAPEAPKAAEAPKTGGAKKGAKKGAK